MQGTVVHHLTSEGVACDAHVTAVAGCKIRVSANAASLADVLKYSNRLFSTVKLDLVVFTVEVKANRVATCGGVALVTY